MKRVRRRRKKKQRNKYDIKKKNVKRKLGCRTGKKITKGQAKSEGYSSNGELRKPMLWKNRFLDERRR